MGTTNKPQGDHATTLTCKLGEKGCFTDGKCYYNKKCSEQVITNADWIRDVSDFVLAEKLYEVWKMEVERGKDLSINWCKGDCGDSDECNPEKHKECILRWLKQPAGMEV